MYYEILCHINPVKVYKSIILEWWRILALGDPQACDRDELDVPGEAVAPCSGQ